MSPKPRVAIRSMFSMDERLEGVQRKKSLAYLLLIIALGLSLRVYNLGWTSLGHDELMTYSRIAGSLSETIRDAASQFPPFYYLLLNIWARIFGVSEFALRFPSLLFSLFSIIVIFKLGEELFTRKIGLLSALLFSLSPYAIQYSHVAKMYSLVWCLGALSFLFFYRFIRYGGLLNALFYVIFSSLSLYTHYSAFLFIVTQNAYFFLFSGKKRPVQWLAMQALVILLFLPWLATLLGQINCRAGVGWIPKTESYLNWVVVAVFFPLGIVVHRDLRLNFAHFFTYLFYMFLIFSALVTLDRKRRALVLGQPDWLLVFWILLPLVVICLADVMFFPILVFRYVGIIHFPLLLLIAKGAYKFTLKMHVVMLIILLCVAAYQSCSFRRFISEKVIENNLEVTLGHISKDADGKYLIVSNVPSRAISYYAIGKEKDIISLWDLKGDIAEKGYTNIFYVFFYPHEYVDEHLKRIERLFPGYAQVKKALPDIGVGYAKFKRR